MNVFNEVNSQPHLHVYTLCSLNVDKRFDMLKTNL